MIGGSERGWGGGQWYIIQCIMHLSTLHMLELKIII